MLFAFQPRSPRRRRFGRAGITIVEIAVSMAMIGIVCSTSMFALIQMNQNSVVARLYTGAMSQAQNQIDLILTAAYKPQNNIIPTVLQPTPSTQATVPIYQDPTSGAVVSGTMVTQVVNLSPTYNGNTLYEVRSTVTVTYSYRNRPYSVALSALRTSDQ